MMDTKYLRHGWIYQPIAKSIMLPWNCIPNREKMINIELSVLLFCACNKFLRLLYASGNHYTLHEKSNAIEFIVIMQADQL